MKLEGEINMKTLLFALTIIFIILTFVGAGYVLMNKGTVNAGYATIPMGLAAVSFSVHKWYKDKK